MNAHSTIAPDARVNAELDEFTAAFIAAFYHWNYCGDLPSSEVSKADKTKAIWQYKGACRAVLQKAPATAHHAAAVAVLAFEHLDTLIANNTHDSDGAISGLSQEELDTLRVVRTGMRGLWQYLDEHGGDGVREFASYWGLESAPLGMVSASETEGAWATAMNELVRAEQAYRRFEAQHGSDVLKKPGRPRDEFDVLVSAASDQEDNLIEMPAPDNKALLWKLEKLLKDDGNGGVSSWCTPYVSQTIADCRRLLGAA